MTNAAIPPGPEKCPACGAETHEGAYYCWLCGRSLRGAAPAAPAARRASTGGTFLAGCLIGPILVFVSAYIAVVVICSGGFR